MIENIVRTLSQKGEIAPLGTDNDIVVMKLDGRKDVNGMVSFLIWSEPVAKPSYYLRTPRSAIVSDLLTEEYKKLCQLRECISNQAVLNSIPEPRYFGQVSGYPVMLMSVLAGKPMYIEFQDRVLSTQRKLRSYIDTSMQWLLLFQKLTAQPVRVDDVIFDRCFAWPIKLFLQTIGDDFRAYGQSLLDELHSLIGEQVTLVIGHGDFSPHNILLLEKDGVGVVDWEDCNLEGAIPLFDVFHYFVVSALLLTPDEKRPICGYEQYFLENSWLAASHRSWQARWKQEWQLSNRWLEILFPVYLMSQAVIGLQEYRNNSTHTSMWLEMLQLYRESL